jgi:uncharacterized protein YjdB
MKRIRPVWLALVLLVAGCSAPSKLVSIAVTPSTATADSGTTVQFIATGTYTHGKHPITTQNISNQVTWSSTQISIATVDSAGLATANESGTTNINATAGSSSSIVTGTATLTVQ